MSSALLCNIISIGGAVYGQEHASDWLRLDINSDALSKKIEALQHSIDLDDSFCQAYLELSVTYLQIKAYEAAREVLKKGLKTTECSPAMPMTLYKELGNIHDDCLRDLDGEQEHLTSQLQEPRLREIYQQASEYLAKNHLSEAITLLEIIEKKLPGDKNVQQKLVDARGLLQKQKERAAISAALERGEDALGKENWPSAIAEFEHVLKLSPDNSAAKRYLTIAKQALGTKQVENLAVKYHIRGLQSLNRDSLQQAILLLENAKQLSQGHDDLTALIDRINDEITKQQRQRDNRDSLYAMLDSLYTNGLTESANGNWNAAVLSFQQIQSLQPNYRHSAYHLEMAKAKLSQLGNRANLYSTYTLVAVLSAMICLTIACLLVCMPMNRARLSTILGHPVRAMAIYERLIEHQPERIPAYVKLASVYLLLDRWDEQARKVYHFVSQLERINAEHERINMIISQMTAHEEDRRN